MRLKSFLIVMLLAIFLAIPLKTSAQSVNEIEDKIRAYQQQIDRLAGQAKTLINQIAEFNVRIQLTQLKISATENKINLLSGKINQLENSLTSLSNAFSSRVAQTYKMTRLSDPLIILFSAPDLHEAVASYHYLQKIQEVDRNLLLDLQKTQNTYSDQKTENLSLQQELTNQKNTLAGEQQSKAYLLQITKNNEKKYQELLVSAQAELAVVLSGGKEAFLRNVNEGDVIGKIIPSASGCSSGQHLHFEVHKDNSVQNPNNYLKLISYSYDYKANEYSYYGTINPHGSWNWPLSEPILINQAFGSHTFARTFYPGGTHNGIDMDSGSSSLVHAVKSGKLYGGSYKCGGLYPGNLLYSKVEQDNGITTWYLHITPQ